MNEQLFGDYQPPSGLEKVANGFRRFGHALSMIPVLSFVAAVPTAIGAMFDSMDGYFNKGFKTGTKNLIAGTVDTTVTQATAWGIPIHQWVSGLATKDSIGELARKGTKGVLDSMIADSKTPAQIAREKMVLGTNPMTRGAVPAGIGYAAGMQPQMAMTAPMSQATGQPMPQNFWSDKEAQRRGQSPKDARANWMSNNREDAVALSRAAAQEAEMGA